VLTHLIDQSKNRLYVEQATLSGYLSGSGFRLWCCQQGQKHGRMPGRITRQFAHECILMGGITPVFRCLNPGPDTARKAGL